MAERRVELCVGAVAVISGRLLLIRRATEPARGRWSVPGGRVEPGERLHEAVLRELREETGLEGEVGEFVGWVERIGPRHHFVIADFRVEVANPATVRAGTDADEARWVPLDELGSVDLVDGLLDFLRDHGIVG